MARRLRPPPWESRTAGCPLRRLQGGAEMASIEAARRGAGANIGGFKKFILRGNVVDLAVGVVIGAAFGKIVDSLVKDIFMPVVGLLTGGFDISKQVLQYKDSTIAWGNFLQTIITFVIVGWCMFMVV